MEDERSEGADDTVVLFTFGSDLGRKRSQREKTGSAKRGGKEERGGDETKGT